MMILAFGLGAVLFGLLLIAITNAFTFPRLQAPCPAADAPLPFVSILVPARNEAIHITHTIHGLLQQTYPHYAVYLLDDHSDDGTGELAQQAAAGDPRLHVYRGAALPAQWLGKNWACHQLAQLAQGDLLLFTDADVCWQPTALAAVVAEYQRSRADLLTVWPTQITKSWGERLVVPLSAFAVLAYLPIALAHHSPSPLAAAANGQCLVFSRVAYQQCGGHAAVRHTVLEDVLLAQRSKATGLKLRMADGNSMLQTRMYQNWPAVRDGYAKNILAGHGNSLFWLACSTGFHGLLFLFPWLWLALGGLGQGSWGWPLWPLGLGLLGLLLRGITAAATRQRLGDALGMPLSVVLMTRIAGQAVWWRVRYGGPQWKGRQLGRG